LNSVSRNLPALARNTTVFAVIPAGGSGSRLWPRSRRQTPKHVLPLGGRGRPLLRETYDRARRFADEVFVLTERRQAEIVTAVLPRLDRDHLILEPSARGTSNAYGLAALTLSERDPDAVMITMPADHVVGNQARVTAAVKKLTRAAAITGNLVTVGLKPTFASIGLGYIHATARGPLGTLRVESFTEKPSLRTAQRFVRSGGYFWNLAWFGWRIPLFLEELGAHAPNQLADLKRVIDVRKKQGEDQAARLYNRLATEVIDRSLMEKTQKLLLVPATFEWTDIGNWAELGDRVAADADGNSVEGEALLIDVKGSLVLGDRRLIAAIGLEDMIIVDTEDAILVCPRSRAQDVKRVVEALGRARKTKYL
jgi:mannose-1-phosphate guanylyltransferase